MVRFSFLFLAVCLSAMSACKKDRSTDSHSSGEFKPMGQWADLVRSPVRPDGTIDSSYLPVITWKDTLYDYGTVHEGDVVIHPFEFTNTGTAPLLILEAKSTCGCTIPEWPKELIPPDSSGIVLVKFNTLHRTGAQSKEVTIFANTFPNQIIIRLSGEVIEK